MVRKVKAFRQFRPESVFERVTGGVAAATRHSNQELIRFEKCAEIRYGCVTTTSVGIGVVCSQPSLTFSG